MSCECEAGKQKCFKDNGSWINNGAAVFALVAWLIGVLILLFGDNSTGDFLVAALGCFVPSILSVSYTLRK